MIWRLSWRADPLAKAIADRHYNRQNADSAQFMPPGRAFVLRTEAAVWGTSWPYAEHVRHAWAGAWVCSIFRREGGGSAASEMIRQAVAATRWRYGEPPDLGMITFLDRAQVRPVPVRGALTWGRTWLLAGFRLVGETQGGLLALRLAPEDMPAPEMPLGATSRLW